MKLAAVVLYAILRRFGAPRGSELLPLWCSWQRGSQHAQLAATLGPCYWGLPGAAEKSSAGNSAPVRYLASAPERSPHGQHQPSWRRTNYCK